MLIRLLDRFPGGRLLVILIPTLLFVLFRVSVSPAELKFLEGVVIVWMTCSLAWMWRDSIVTYFRETRQAHVIWFTLAMIIFVVTSLLNSLYSNFAWYFNIPLRDDVTSATRYAYDCAYACLFLATVARDSLVPPSGWVTLCVIVTTAVFVGAVLLYVR